MVCHLKQVGAQVENDPGSFHKNWKETGNDQGDDMAKTDLSKRFGRLMTRQ